jgi:hypothetical protein
MSEHDETTRMTEDHDERGCPGSEGSKYTPPPLPKLGDPDR